MAELQSALSSVAQEQPRCVNERPLEGWRQMTSRSEPPFSPEVNIGYRRQLEALDSLIHSHW